MQVLPYIIRQEKESHSNGLITDQNKSWNKEPISYLCIWW